MTTIMDRHDGKKYWQLYEEEGQNMLLVTLGNGTASGAVLDYLGLEGTEKGVIFNVTTQEGFTKIKKSLRKKLQIDAPGGGIAFTVPLSSVGGKKTMQLFTAGQEFEKEEESVLKDTEYELVIVIANLGYNELVMNAAREAGAYGGTVIHARGTGVEYAEKFMGVSLAAEKEIIFIVAKKEAKNGIMQAVMEKAGMDTKAKSIVFSLPVTDTAGLRLIEDEESAS